MPSPSEFPDYIGVTDVTTRSHDQMLVEAFMDGQHSIMADEPKGFDIGDPPVLQGQSRGWTPVHYQLAALSMCTSITVTVVANDQGFAYRDLRTAIRSLIDIRGFFFDLHLQPKFEQVSLDLTLDTKEPAARIKALAEETDRRCPQLGLFRAAGVPMVIRWRRKGEKEPVHVTKLAIRGKLPEDRLRDEAARQRAKAAAKAAPRTRPARKA
ncbi:MAG: OsmC family protein [Thermoleophilia bacterium]